MSVFYQFPQYIAIGLSEVFTAVASLEFAYLAAPQSAQSLVMSLRFTSAGLSSFLGSAYVTIYESINHNFTITNSEVLNKKNQSFLSYKHFLISSVQIKKNLNYSIFIFLFLLVFNSFSFSFFSDVITNINYSKLHDIDSIHVYLWDLIHEHQILK